MPVKGVVLRYAFCVLRFLAVGLALVKPTGMEKPPFWGGFVGLRFWETYILTALGCGCVTHLYVWFFVFAFRTLSSRSIYISVNHFGFIPVSLPGWMVDYCH